MSEPNRKLAAILSADVAGYSRLMAADEAATVETLKKYRAAIGRVIARHKGSVVNAPGDNILAQFPSAVEAVQAAVEIQKVLEGRNLELAPERRMQVLIGVNLGDVIEEEDGTLYGDGVNIAARMEALAEAGGICVSSSVYDAVAGKIDFGFDFLGAQQVKNIDRPINVYRVRSEPGAAAVQPAEPQAERRRRPTLSAAAGAAAALVVIAAGAYWLLRPAPETVPTAEAPDAAPTASEDPVLALPTGPSIAVLPFDNLSGDPEQTYFADGIAEEIITGLTRFRDLFVIARNSTFQYKGRSVDIRRIGEELGVQYVVEGSVRRAAETIRITAQLTDAATGAHLWAESYDRALTAENVLTVQDEITDAIVGAIADSRGVLYRAEQRRSQNTEIASINSYDCVLQAREVLVEVTAEKHLRGRECLEHTVKIDPNYAEAWAMLAEMNNQEYTFGWNPQPGEPLSRALEAARTAVRLDPTNQIAHYAMAAAHWFRNDIESFLKESEIALELNRNNAGVLAYLGYLIANTGQWERGTALVKKAMALNPHGPTWVWVAIYNNHYRKHEYEEALSAHKNWENPGFYWIHANLASLYGQLGQKDNARGEIAKLLDLYPDFASEARQEIEIWIKDRDYVELWLDGLRKAGLDVPEEPAAPQ